MFAKISKLSFAVATLLLAGCTDNNYEELDKGNTPLAITPSASSVMLQETYHSQAAMTIDWTSGTNYGSGNRISYDLELGVAGSNFENGYMALAGVQNTYEWKPTVEELNAIALDELGLTSGAETELEARVTAIVDGVADNQTAVCKFVLTPYKPVSEQLFIQGSSVNGAMAMARTDNGIFSWTGNLKTGDYVFTLSSDSLYPRYANDGEGNMVLVDDASAGGDPFHCDEEHMYKIDVDLLKLAVTVTKVDKEAPEFTEAYFVGNETDWNFVAMTPDPLNPYLFRIGVFFQKGGEFKFGSASGSWENMFKATAPNAPYTSTGVDFVTGFDPDNKWFLNASEANKAYKIVLDTRRDAMKMLMSPFTPYSTIWMVGDATPNGWSLDNATPLVKDTSDDNIFTWTGHLNAGQLKFSCDKQSDWNGAWFLAPEEDAPASGTTQHTIFIDKSSTEQSELYPDLNLGDVDLKWKITEAGNYTITLDQLLETVTIIKNQ